MIAAADRLAERARLAALVTKPPLESRDWGVVQTRAWLKVVQRHRRCLRRNARLKTLRRAAAAIEAVSAMPLDELVEML